MVPKRWLNTSCSFSDNITGCLAYATMYLYYIFGWRALQDFPGNSFPELLRIISGALPAKHGLLTSLPSMDSLQLNFPCLESSFFWWAMFRSVSRFGVYTPQICSKNDMYKVGPNLVFSGVTTPISMVVITPFKPICYYKATYRGYNSRLTPGSHLFSAIYRGPMSLLMIPHLLQESPCPGHRLQARRGDLSQMSNERGSGGCLGQIINLMYTFSTGDFLGNIGYHHWRSEALKIKVADLSPNYTFSETSRHTWILWI